MRAIDCHQVSLSRAARCTSRRGCLSVVANGMRRSGQSSNSTRPSSASCCQDEDAAGAYRSAEHPGRCDSARSLPADGDGLTAGPDAPRYLFPGSRARARPMRNNTVTAALRRIGYRGKRMTAHGFLANARTLLAELGWSRTRSSGSLRTRPAARLVLPTTGRTFSPWRRWLCGTYWWIAPGRGSA